jgi:hypothetical protein
MAAPVPEIMDTPSYNPLCDAGEESISDIVV